MKVRSEKVLAEINMSKITFVLIYNYGSIYSVIPLLCQISIKFEIIKNAGSHIVWLQLGVTKVYKLG